MKASIKYIFFIAFVIVAHSCINNTEEPMFTDSFDRSEMLEFWANDIIIPGYTDYVSKLAELDEAATDFYGDPSDLSLSTLRETWLDAYKVWQAVSLFEIGKAEEIGLRNFTNIYPANIDLITENINSGASNLDLPSNFVSQGFPALDYMLYGSGSNDAVIAYLLQEEVKNYTQALITRLRDLSSSVLEDWMTGYKDEFISNNGSSGTASTDKMVNDFLFHYERFLRAAKVGIPAGVFSGNTEAELVEGRYSQIYSKELFESGFTAVQAFFNGQSYDGQKQGSSLKQYLDKIHLDNSTDLDYSESIIAQWDSAERALEDINNNFGAQVIEDNSKMLALYDELQKAVVLLKVDMLQALNIQVDFVDADGD